VDAKDLDQNAMKFDGIEVQGSDGEKLGDVEGFIVDAEGRPRHVAVSAGWFFHKHFLLPIDHVGMDDGGTKLRADLTKERVNRFPGFDKDQFDRLGAEELEELDQRLATAAGTTDIGSGDGAGQYRTPRWWQASDDDSVSSARR